MPELIEIVAAPLQLWLGPVGTAYPLIDDAVSTFDPAWVSVGTNGNLDQDSNGVTVTHNETLSTFTPSGSTVPVGAWRTDESLEVAVAIADFSPAQYAMALNNATVTTVAAITGAGARAGYASVPLMQGTTVATFALLARGVSGLNPDGNAQYEVPCCYQSANPAPVFKKGTPTEMSLTYTTLLDPNGGGMGQLLQQTA